MAAHDQETASKTTSNMVEETFASKSSAARSSRHFPRLVESVALDHLATRKGPRKVSRRQKALLATGFTYVQWILAVLTGLFLTRFLIHRLGAELYGTWLATGALLTYASLADLGILGVMPWLVAEADGAEDRSRLRSLASHGVTASIVGAALYLAIAFCLWTLLPGLIHLSSVERETLRGPIIVMVLVTVLGYPLRVGSAIRQGLQDYAFLGGLGVQQTLLNVAIVVGLGVAGAPLYGVALGATFPAFLSNAVAFGRTLARDPDLFSEWKLQWSVFRMILSSGGGQWLASVGWQLAFASDAVVIGYLGRRELVPVFAVTSRLGLTLMQLSWTLPDSTTVGLVQLNAQGNRERTAEVIVALLRFHLLTSGLIACGLLAGNAGFVSAWVGSGFFGGSTLNAMIAIDVIVLTMVHGVVVPVGALGKRMTVGLLTAANGVAHIVLAVLFGKIWGLSGVAIATALSALVTTLPGGVALLSRLTTLTTAQLAKGILLPWSARALPCLAVAAVAGWFVVRSETLEHTSQPRALLIALVAGGLAGFTYLLAMRSLVRDLPLGPRLRQALLSLRLV
jgi:O-antigen/teichoic acid export membrane protein